MVFIPSSRESMAKKKEAMPPFFVLQNIKKDNIILTIKEGT